MMTTNESTTIKVKALGLHWRGGALLVSEIRGSDGTLKGVRPLGGTVEPGETTQQTLIREMREELDTDVSIDGLPIVLENIFHHRGAAGHEIVFLYPISFPPGAFADQDVLYFTEDNGENCTARWFPLDQLDTPGGLPLYPNDLKKHLRTPDAD